MGKCYLLGYKIRQSYKSNIQVSMVPNVNGFYFGCVNVYYV